MDRCPCCNARLKTAKICPRCKADLSPLFAAEKSARYWLTKAIQYTKENNTQSSIQALNHSIHLKRTDLALAFRIFLIRQLCTDVLTLLTKNELLSAKHLLNQGHTLIPYSKLLNQLNLFTDYLLVYGQDRSNL